MSTTVILAAGLFPSTPRALDFLRRADYIACCDGAANACVDAGFEPDVIVGDGDSVREDVRARYADRIVRIAEQETNDLTKTFHHVLSNGRRDRFVILGATGKREDHALANLALLMDYAEEHASIRRAMFFAQRYLRGAKSRSSISGPPIFPPPVYNIRYTTSRGCGRARSMLRGVQKSKSMPMARFSSTWLNATVDPVG